MYGWPPSVHALISILALAVRGALAEHAASLVPSSLLLDQPSSDLPATLSALLIESDPRRSSHLVGLLASASNVRVHTVVAASLAESVELLDKRPFDAVLTRLRLPDAKGLDALVRLQAIAHRPPIIALLEDDEKNVILDAAQSLADDCLFYGDLDTDLLARSLSLAIDRRQMLRELRQKQTAAAASGTPFRALLDHFDEALFLVSREDGKALFVNQVAHAWFGATLDDTLSDVLEYGVLLGADIEIEIATGNVHVPHAELRSVSIEWRGLPCCLVSLRNISKRKRAEEAYKASQRRLDLALKASNIGLWSWDLRGHQLQYSDRWKAQLGYKPHEFPNTLSAFRRALHPDDKDKALADFRAILKKERKDFECEFRLRHARDGYRSILCRAEVFPDAEGRLAMVLGTHIDITERRRESEAARLAAMAQNDDAAQRLREQLARRFEDVTRELERTAVEMRSYFRSDSAIAVRIQEMEALAKRAAALNGFLSPDQQSSDAAGKPFLLSALIERIRGRLAQLLPSNAKLAIEYAGECVVARVGEAYAELLLAEALSMVSRSLRTEIRCVVILRGRCDFADGQGLALEIEYSGSRVSEELIASLPRREGVTVFGQERDGGASLTLRFPLAEAAGEMPAGETAAGERPKLALLAEDEGVLRFAICSMLEALDYDVALAVDGALALDQFFERPDDFSLALVDLHMPVIDGHSVVESIRSRRPDLPILKMSGDDGDSVGESFGGEESQCCFLSKPFGASELRQAIASLTPESASAARPS